MTRSGFSTCTAEGDMRCCLEAVHYKTLCQRYYVVYHDCVRGTTYKVGGRAGWPGHQRKRQRGILHLLHFLAYYRVLHNSLPFLFPEMFVWSHLLWLSVTLSLSVVQRIWAEMIVNQLFCGMNMLPPFSLSLIIKLSRKVWLINFSKWTSNPRTRFFAI